MEGGDLYAGGIEQLRLERIEKGMPELVAHDVGTLAGKGRPSRGRPMEELQAFAVIEGIEVDTEIEINGQAVWSLPPKTVPEAMPSRSRRRAARLQRQSSSETPQFQADEAWPREQRLGGQFGSLGADPANPGQAFE